MVRLPQSVNPEAALRQTACPGLWFRLFGTRFEPQKDARIPAACRGGRGVSIACDMARLISACR